MQFEEKHLSKMNRRYEPHVRILERTMDYTNMTLNDAINIISLLFKSSKHTRNINNVIGKHPNFVHLCEVLNRHIRVMKTHDVIECLKILTRFKVPSNSILIQSLLQMIRTTVNDISLQDIIFIVFLLKKMDSTPLRDALMIALPLVFEAQFTTKLDSDDASLLTSSLRFISQNNMNSLQVQDTILRSLCKHESGLDVKSAWSAFNSLCCMSDLPPIAFQVLHNLQRILVANARELNVRQIVQLLDKLASVIAQKYVYNRYK